VNLKEQRAAELKAAQDIAAKAQAEQRDLTDQESGQVAEHVKKVHELDERIKRAADNGATLKALGELGDNQSAPAADHAAKSLGEHFVKHAGKRMQVLRGVKGASAAAPEFTKVATDPHTVGSVFGPVLTQIDRNIVQGVRPRLVIADLLGSGALSGNAIQYFVEGTLEGAFTTVAEGGAKPQMHVADPTTVTEALKKIAGFIKLTDEMTEDLDFVVSEINGRLLYELAKFEEQQLLSGDGVGSNLVGILNRSGIQTLGAAADPAAGNPDQVFRAMTAVGTGSGLDADGIVINPTDYQALRLSRDASGQYYGGGFFAGQYGDGTLTAQPPLWGLRTVVTPAITAGTVLVGAYAQAATVYRKGGVRVESTNSHADDFTNNLVTVRAEERLALAVRRPAAFVKVTLGTA
jgi:HK97 family phage major capsid protein